MAVIGGRFKLAGLMAIRGDKTTFTIGNIDISQDPAKIPVFDRGCYNGCRAFRPLLFGLARGAATAAPLTERVDPIAGAGNRDADPVAGRSRRCKSFRNS
jgi:hypothetical protein